MSVTRRRALLGSALAGGVVTAGGLAGCGTPAQEAAPTKAGTCAGTLEVVSFANVGTPTGDGLAQLGQDFNAAHQGCKAEMLFIPGNNSQILEKLVSMGAAGTPPAAALVPAQQTPLWIESGVLQPLDKWAKRDGIGRELFFDGYWPQMVIQGTMWRLPFQMDVNHVWFWHKNALRTAGFNPDQAPTSIEKVDEMALKLTRGGAGGYEQYGLVPWLASQETAAMQTWGFAFGGEFYDAAKDRVTADHPKIVEALEWMVGWARRLGGYDAVMQHMADLGGPDKAFANGKIATNGLNSTALNAARIANPGIDVASALFPGAAGLKPGEATWLSGRGAGMSAGAKDPESAWAFVKWVGATKEGTLAAVNRIAATPGLKASPGLAVLEKDPQLKPFVDAVKVAKKNPISALISTQIWGSGRNVMLQEALQQKRAPREAMTEISRTAQVEHEAVRAKQKR